MSVVARPLERQCHHRFLIVGIGFFPDERVDETLGSFHLPKHATQVERFSLRRLHRDSVAPSLAHVELDLRRREPRRPPPFRELVGFDARCEHTLTRGGERPFEVQLRGHQAPL